MARATTKRRLASLNQQLHRTDATPTPAAAAADATVVASYVPYLSVTSQAREPSALRELYPLLKLPGMLSLGNGQPNPDSFPFAKLSVTTRDGEVLDIDGAEMNDAQQYADTLGTEP